MFKKLGLALIGISIGASAGFADEFSAALPALEALQQGAQAVKAMPQAPSAYVMSGTTVVPMPTAPTEPKLSAEQMQKLASAAAVVYQAQGKPWLAKWYCVANNSIIGTTTNGWTMRGQNCMQPHGKVESGNYELSSLPLKMIITAQDPNSGESQEIAEMNGVVQGDGSIDQANWKVFTQPSSVPSAEATMTREIDYWMSYKQ